MKKETGKMIDILLVEDNAGDAELIKIALRKGKLHNALHVVTDGVQAMKFLRQEDEYSDFPCPDLILLDLNLPRKSGLEVLREVKGDPELRFIPVVILTSSKEEQDIFKSYCLSANCFVTKPVDFQEFIDAVKSIEDYWLTFVKLPFRAGKCVD